MHAGQECVNCIVLVSTMRVLRKFYFHKPCRNFSTSQRASKDRLVVLGTGWGSYSVVKSIDKKLYDVVVVSPRNHFLFTPLLCMTTVGTMEFRSIIEPIRNSAFKSETNYHFASAQSVDTEQQVVTCINSIQPSQGPYNLSYDKLVIGVGAQPNTFNVPGVKEHAFFLKEVSDARRIRNRLLDNFELAVSPLCSNQDKERYDHIVIVGGGPTGVEFGAELYDFVKQDLGKLYPQSQPMVKVTLIEANNILSTFPDALRQYAEKKIKKREQFSLVKDSVAEVKADGVQLSSGKFLPCGLVVWSAGVAPLEFTSRLPFSKNKIGQILTDKTLRVVGVDKGNVFAIGDCADIVGNSLPCTAQVAEKEGRYLANRLNGKSDDEFEFKGVGMLAYIGEFKAVSELRDFKDSGFTSWILWRSAYFTRLGSWRLRMQAPLDWFKTFFFGRDTSRFN